jgi:Deoxyinosine 3''endonuclease (endonuclease V)
MILAFDTYYFDNKAKTVCISFNSWTENENYEVHSEILENIEDYTSGEFYKRELPCIMSLLKMIDCSKVKAIIIDGFVFLDDNLKLGLGGYLYKEFDSKIPVIGIAKTNFATIENLKRLLFRGESKKPLYITSIGIDLDKATDLIKNMEGDYRIPTLLKKLDTLTKEII